MPSGSGKRQLGHGSDFKLSTTANHSKLADGWSALGRVEGGGIVFTKVEEQSQ